MLWQRRTALGLRKAAARLAGTCLLGAMLGGCAVDGEGTGVGAGVDATGGTADGVVGGSGGAASEGPLTPLGPWQHCAFLVPGPLMAFGTVPMGEFRQQTACIVGCAGVEVIDGIRIEGDDAFWISGEPLWGHGFPNATVPTWGRPLVLREGDTACFDVGFYAEPKVEKTAVGSLHLADLRVERRFGPPLELPISAFRTLPPELDPPDDPQQDPPPEPLIRIQLTWTPLVGSGSASSPGTPPADLDLHLIHPLAKGKDHDCDGKPDGVFDPVLDCSFRNPAPLWDPPSGANPKLVQSDVSAAAEALVVQDVPLGASDGSLDRYRIVVHHFHDRGQGAVRARIEIAVNGTTVETIEHPALEPGALWLVGHLNLPNVHTTPSTPVPALTRCQQQGEVCDGGAMWTGVGSPCTRQCYPLPAVLAQIRWALGPLAGCP